MNQSTNTPVPPFDWLIDRIPIVIREELAMANNAFTGGITDKDALLTVDEAAALMNVKTRWLYRHAQNFRSRAVSIEKLFAFLKPVYVVGWQQKSRPTLVDQ